MADLTIAGYTPQTRTHLANVNYGSTDLYYRQDTDGSLLGFEKDRVINFDSGESIATGYIPALPACTFSEKLSGNLEDLDAGGNGLGTFSERTENRALVKDNVNGNKYYIDGVLQGYVPTIPDDSVAIILDNTATIGHPDTVDRRSCGFVIANFAKGQAAVNGEIARCTSI